MSDVPIAPPEEEEFDPPTEQYLNRPKDTNTGTRGPKPFIITDADRAVVKALIAVRCSTFEIGAYLGVSERTISTRFKDELAVGRAWLKPNIAFKIIQKALRGDNACMFKVMDRFYGWKEPQETRVELTGAKGGPIDVRSTPTDALEQAYALLREGAVAGADAEGAGQKVYEGQPSGLV